MYFILFFFRILYKQFIYSKQQHRQTPYKHKGSDAETLRWLGPWGPGALGAGGSAFRRRAASGRLSAALGGVEHACVRERRERAPRDSSKYKSL